MYGWEKLKGELEKLAPHHCFGSCRATQFSLRTFGSYSASKCPAQENPMSAFERRRWEWENATAGAIAGFATVAAMHPLDVVRTRFAVNDGRLTNLPSYKNTAHAIFTITRLEGLRGLYAGFYPAVLGSTVSWGLYFLFYGRAKQRYSKNGTHTLSPGLHLAAAAEAGALVSFCTNPIWLIKTRLQLETPLHQSRPYSGLYDALRTILKEEGWCALYRGIAPSLFLVSHGAVQFMVYEELRKFVVDFKSKEKGKTPKTDVKLLDSVDYAAIGASSKLAAILMTYPFQVIRARLQQRPNHDGIPRYVDTWHVVKETARFEGFRGFYKGITPSILKNLPAASITFIVLSKGKDTGFEHMRGGLTNYESTYLRKFSVTYKKETGRSIYRV